MKIVILIFIVVSVAIYFVVGNEIFIIISDISEVLFFAFSTMSIVVISAILGIETGRVLRYKTLNIEYEALKMELHSHITRNCFSIEITKEASLKHKEYEQIEKEISKLKKGEYYES